MCQKFTFCNDYWLNVLHQVFSHLLEAHLSQHEVEDVSEAMGVRLVEPDVHHWEVKVEQSSTFS